MPLTSTWLRRHHRCRRACTHHEHGATSSASLTITVTGVNDAPVTVKLGHVNSGLEDTTITYKHRRHQKRQ